MARLERPVDPADGPMQALAHELRKLRVDAGNPTYRTLARRTGYSASTLSEAANGQRKPTLDVLLAYVGALNGDLDEWRERWEALGDGPGGSGAGPSMPEEPVRREGERQGEEQGPSDALAAPEQSRPPRGAATPPETATPEEPAMAEEAVSGWRGRRRASRVVTAGGLALVVALAIVSGVFRWGSHGKSAPAAGGTGCPAAVQGAVFYARTYGSGTTIRQGPARVEKPLATVPAGCTVGLTGYCAGEPIIDSTAYTPDVRWFIVAGGGVLASATVHGNPPAGMTLSRCPGDRPLPTAITLHMAGDTLTAAGRGVEVVGYAAYYDGAWHQIGLTGPGRGDFATGWRPVKATVAAAACLGGEGATGVTDLRAYPAGGESRLAEPQRKAAGQVACLYPTAK